MIVGQTAVTVPANDKEGTGWQAFGSWAIDAYQAYTAHDIAQAELHVAQTLQEQGIPAAQAQAIAQGRPVPTAMPGLLQNPLVMGGLAMLAGVVIYKLMLKK